MINTVIPMLFAYGVYKKQDRYQQKALSWLEQMSSEKNGIIREFSQYGIEAKTAYDTQALIQLRKNYCSQKHCLRCAIGTAMLKGELVNFTDHE